jgi:hypothetical protein
MSDLKMVLPAELRKRTLWPGNELVLPYAAASSAVNIATEHQVAVLGLLALEVLKDGLRTVDCSEYCVPYTDDWLSYVIVANADAGCWLDQHTYGANYGYVLTSASNREFAKIQKLHRDL